MKRAFTSIIDNLKTTIVDYEYYVNFEKIYYQVWNYLVELNILNLLIGSKNIEEDFIKIINDYPKVISVLPLLLAVTKFDIPVIDHYLITYNFKTKSMSNNEYVNFMKKLSYLIYLKTKERLFLLIEVNFYNAGGSKLNSEASRFKTLSKTISKLDNVTFVWITDGIGWKTAKSNLKEAYDEIENFYTLLDLENGVLEKLFK